MGLFDKVFKRPRVQQLQQFFDTFSAYTPAFQTWHGGVYESELVRAAIHARATHISKLKIEMVGSAQPLLQTRLKYAPNEFQTWSQFLYRVSTILDTQNNCFIVPIYNAYEEIVGIYPVLPSAVKMKEHDGEPWIQYEFERGQTAALPLRDCGLLTKFQYKDEFFGENNNALNSTMKLVNIQQQGIEEGVKSAATYRFMARKNNFAKMADLAKERREFSDANFGGEGGGLLLFPNTYDDIRQIESKPFVVDAAQMQLIQKNVFNYFGVNEDVLQNKCVGDSWSAFYEGAVEAFAIQFSEVMTKMLFTQREAAFGSRVMATANRLQYMSNNEKLAISRDLADRGILNRDEVREIWNLAPLPDGEGQEYIIRGEYWNANEKINNGGAENGEA